MINFSGELKNQKRMSLFLIKFRGSVAVPKMKNRVTSDVWKATTAKIKDVQ